MRETGPPGVGGPLVAVCLLLVPAATLAGCIAEPSTGFQLRPGDLAQAQVLVWNEEGIVFPPEAVGSMPQELCSKPLQEASACPQASRPYTLSPDSTETLPPGYEDAAVLPPGLAEALTGHERGDTVREDQVKAWGSHREGLVEEHPVTEALPRLVEAPSAYGADWETSRTEEGLYRIQPSENQVGISLQVERWCNERFCLFESTFQEYNASHLLVEHEPEKGSQVHVEELDSTLTITDVTSDRFVVDGNHRHAGEAFDVYVHIEDARGAPSSAERAPGFEATTLNGSTVSLAGLLGQPVVLEFFATWCPSCEQNAQHLADVEHRFGDEVAVVSIGVDPWEKAASFQRFIDDHNVTWPVVVDQDGSLSSAYGVGSLSTEVIVSPDGFIIHTETGVADHERVVSVLAELVEEHDGPGLAEGTQ